MKFISRLAPRRGAIRAWAVLGRRWYAPINVDVGRPKTRRGKRAAERQADATTEKIPSERVVKLLDDIEKGLTDMIRANEHFVVHRSELEVRDSAKPVPP